MSKTLSTVFAVQTREGFYLPRSVASDTDCMPKLFAKRLDAERAISHPKVGQGTDWRNTADWKIVEFQLVPVDTPTLEERVTLLEREVASLRGPA